MHKKGKRKRGKKSKFTGLRNRNRKRNPVDKSKLNFEKPNRATYTKKDDVIDYLSEDDEITNQKFVCVSFAEIQNEEQLKVMMNEVSGKTGYPESVVTHIITEWTELEHPKRALKIRGVTKTYKEGCERAEEIREGHGQNFHVFTAEVGKWLPYNPDPEKLSDENYYEKEINNMLKAYKINKKKTDIHYQQRKREMMEKAIFEGTTEGQDALMKEKEPYEAVEYRSKMADKEIKSLEEKIEDAKRIKNLAQQKLKYMETNNTGPSKTLKSPLDEEMPSISSIDVESTLESMTMTTDIDEKTQSAFDMIRKNDLKRQFGDTDNLKDKIIEKAKGGYQSQSISRSNDPRVQIMEEEMITLV